MGWASGGAYFDVVADALIESEANDETKYAVCKALISALRDGDWDTEGESLGMYADDPTIVRAFRECGVYVHCNDEYEDGVRYYTCDREENHDGDHKDPWLRKTWPRK